MIGSVKRVVLFMGASMTLLSGCGVGIEEPTEMESVVSSGEASNAERNVKAMACDPRSYQGSGSCHYSCTAVGTCSGTTQWNCTAYNYDHYKTATGADNYIARWNQAFSVTKCQSTNPRNCPAFCN